MPAPEHASALAAWRALPAATRRSVRRLAGYRDEPHPDPAVAAAAAYATARLATLRRIPAFVPVLAGTASVATLVIAAIMTRRAGQAASPGPVLLVLLPLAGMAVSLGGLWWCLHQMKLLPQRLRKLAEVGQPEPGQVIIRCRRHQAARLPAAALLGGAIGCVLLGHQWVPLGSGLTGLAFPLAGLAWRTFRSRQPGLPEPAACRIGRAGVEFPGSHLRAADRRTGQAGPRRLAWDQLTRIAVFEPPPGARGDRQAPVIVLLDSAGAERLSLLDTAGPPPAPGRQPPVPAAGYWLREHVSPFLLYAGKLDKPAGEIIAALTAHAPVPVEHRPLPDPFRRGPAGAG